MTGRRADRLEEIAARLRRSACEVIPLAFDLANRAEAENAFAKVSNHLARISILVNNAGLARGPEKLQDANIDDLEAMVDTNVKGLLYATRTCLPHLIKNEGSHIVNVGSVAGRWTYPGGAVYCATKFAVRALTEVRLGGDKEKAKAVYKGMQPLVPHDIAETIVWCLDRPAHVNIQELVIYPTAQAGVGPSYTTRT